jgi:hypothetical protein
MADSACTAPAEEIRLHFVTLWFHSGLLRAPVAPPAFPSQRATMFGMEMLTFNMKDGFLGRRTLPGVPAKLPPLPSSCWLTAQHGLTSIPPMPPTDLLSMQSPSSVGTARASSRCPTTTTCASAKT